jgi:hypothetical protein
MAIEVIESELMSVASLKTGVICRTLVNRRNMKKR